MSLFVLSTTKVHEFIIQPSYFKPNNIKKTRYMYTCTFVMHGLFIMQTFASFKLGVFTIIAVRLHKIILKMLCLYSATIIVYIL